MADLEHQRRRMVQDQLQARGIHDPRVLQAMTELRREEFVPAEFVHRAYEDSPQPIGHGQTISQPFIVAWMTQLLQPGPDDIVLEIGTGCGYQTAVLAKLCRKVFTMERVPELARQASINLQRAGIENFELRIADGTQGWPDDEAVPQFPRILCAAAPADVPPALIEQLAPEGRLVLPLGPRQQQWMTLIRKDSTGRPFREELGLVAFVPLVADHPRA